MSEWISVKERMPEEGKRVLVYRPDLKVVLICEYYKVSQNWRDCGEWHGDDDYDFHIQYGTHWMPLPEPPEGK
jgi:hypothetical protein